MQPRPQGRDLASPRSRLSMAIDSKRDKAIVYAKGTLPEEKSLRGDLSFT